MKYQIRKNVFETNSSTQHTLTICHDTPDYSKYIGKTIVLGGFEDDNYFWNNDKGDPEVKLNMIWCYLTQMKVGCFIKRLKYIQKAFEPLNIKIDVIDDADKYEEYEWGYSWGYMFDYLFDGETPDRLIDFVFNKDSWYDSYEDNAPWGCPYEKDIKEGNETLWDRDG